MTGKTPTKQRFPLPLSSLGDTSVKRQQSATKSIATPQTATQNARHHQVNATKKTVATSAPMQRHPVISNNIAPNVNDERNNNQPAQTVRTQSINTNNTTQQAPTQSKSVNNFKQTGHDGYEAPRRAMVARVQKQGVQDAIVLAAMEVVPRHVFIESGLIGQAYIDASLPIGQQQTISQPYIVARMIEIMRNGRQLNNVLEIGTGCGYQAAVLSQLCNQIYSIERIKQLHELAKNNLRNLRIANLRLHYGDGMQGLPQVAPFDGIILAAAGLQIPDALLEQLAIGGRLIAPVGDKQQVLQCVERTDKTTWAQSILEECHFVPLRPGMM